MKIKVLKCFDFIKDDGTKEPKNVNDIIEMTGERFTLAEKKLSAWGGGFLEIIEEGDPHLEPPKGKGKGKGKEKE